MFVILNLQERTNDYFVNIIIEVVKFFSGSRKGYILLQENTISQFLYTQLDSLPTISEVVSLRFEHKQCLIVTRAEYVRGSRNLVAARK